MIHASPRTQDLTTCDARGTRRQYFTRDERRHETTESQRSVNDSSSERRFALNAGVPLITNLIINFKRKLKSISNSREEHTQAFKQDKGGDRRPLDFIFHAIMDSGATSWEHHSKGVSMEIAVRKFGSMPNGTVSDYVKEAGSISEPLALPRRRERGYLPSHVR